MVLGRSKEECQKLEEQYDRKVEEVVRAEEAIGENKKRDIDEANEKALEEIRLQNQNEVREEAKKSLQLVEQQIAQLEQERKDHQEGMLKWKTKAAKKAKKMTDEMNSEEKLAAAQRQKDFEKEEAKLKTQRNELNSVRDKMKEILAEGEAGRNNTRLKYQERGDQQHKEHMEYIKNANTKLNKYVQDKYNELRMLEQAGGNAKLALTRDIAALKADSTVGAQNLLTALDNGNAHDEFRLNCGDLRMRFKNFKDACSAQEQLMTRVCMEMRFKKPLTNAPREKVIQETHTQFKKDADVFNIPDDFIAELQAPLVELREKSQMVANNFAEIRVFTEVYQDDLKKEPINKVELQEYYEDVKSLFEKTQKTLEQLNKLIKKFDICASNHISAELMKQTLALKNFSDQRKIAIGTGEQKQLTKE